MPVDKLQSEAAITRFIDSKGGPPRLKRVDNIKKIQFHSTPTDQRTFRNKFPFGDFDIAGIHVAVQVSLGFVFVCVYISIDCFTNSGVLFIVRN